MWRSVVIAAALGAVLVATAAAKNPAKDPWDPYTKIRAADQDEGECPRW